MLLRKTILVGLALCIACAGHAQSVKLTSNQILELLSGKTVVGSWSGKDYRQYFDEDGTTTFLGKDNYCSIYDVRPKACREFPHTDRIKQSQLLKLTEKNIEVCPAVFEIVEKLKKELVK